MQCKGATGLSTDPLCFSFQIIEHAYENKTRSGFIDRQRKGASLAHSQRLEARIKVFSGSSDYRIRISSLRFFLLPERILGSKNENLTMTSELNRPTESFSGIQTNASWVGDARECCHPCYTGLRAILARNVTSRQHFARSRLTATGNRR